MKKIVNKLILIPIILICVVFFIFMTSYKNNVKNSHKTTNIQTKKDIAENTTNKKAKNSCSIEVIPAQDSENAILTDSMSMYTILINDIPDFERIYGCSSFIEYYSDKKNIIINYHLYEGITENHINNYTTNYLNNNMYENKILNKEEFQTKDTLTNIEYSGMNVEYENDEEQYREIILNHKMDDNIILSVEIIEKKESTNYEKKPSEYIYLLQPDMVNILYNDNK